MPSNDYFGNKIKSGVVGEIGMAVAIINRLPSGLKTGV
jgi:hypothetical protein